MAAVPLLLVAFGAFAHTAYAQSIRTVNGSLVMQVGGGLKEIDRADRSSDAHNGGDGREWRILVVVCD